MCPALLHRERRFALLRRGHRRPVSARGHVHRPDPAGRKNVRSADPATHQIRTPRQSQGRQGARPRGAADATRPRRRGDRMKRREFISLIGGAAAWPLAARAQQSAVPVIGLVNAGSREASASRVAAFRKGLSETGYVEGQNVAVEYHWFSGEYDRLSTLMADLVRRRVAVIATPGGTLAASAAKAATTTIPIVFGVGEDPVKLGLVSSLARPGANATGINVFIWEVAAKRLGLLHELAPRAVRVAVLINPGNVPSAEATLRDLPEAARAIGLQIQILNASTSREIEAAFATLVRDRADALIVAPETFFISRRVQFVTLAMRHGIPSAHSTREEVEAGGLMSYGTDIPDMWRQVGVYAGQVLNGAKPADLPVVQPT